MTCKGGCTFTGNVYCSVCHGSGIVEGINKPSFVSRLILEAETPLEREAVTELQIAGLEITRLKARAEKLDGFSEPTVCRDYEGDKLASVTVDWSRKGYRSQTIVADDLIDQWAADLNELERLRAIVRDLAAVQPIVGHEDMWFACAMCDAEGSYSFDDVGNHDPGCPWLRATREVQP